MKHAANAKRVLRFVFGAIRNFVVKRAETLCAMAVCVRAHIRCRKAEDFCEWMFWFHLIPVVIKAAGLFEDAGELHAARAQVVNVSLGVLVAVFKGALLLGLAPEDLVVAVGVEGRVYVNQIHAGVGQLGELFQIVAAVNDAGVEEGAWA